jgi:hypothetical protein
MELDLKLAAQASSRKPHDAWMMKLRRPHALEKHVLRKKPRKFSGNLNVAIESAQALPVVVTLLTSRAVEPAV